MSLRGYLKNKPETRRGYLKSRSGRRSMSVDTLLRKEKDGSLEKYTKLGAAEDPTENKDGFKSITTIAMKNLRNRILEGKQVVKISADKTASDKVQKKTEFQGIPIHIDRPKGYVQVMKHPGDPPRVYKTDYGFIPGVIGKDGDELDVYMGPSKKAPHAFVIKQMLGGKHDEDKVMLGFKDEQAARKMFLRHFTNPAVISTVIGGVKSVPMDKFKAQMLKKTKDKTANYREGDDPRTTGMPAFAKRGKKQLPSREEMDLNPTPKVESRQESRGTVLSDQYTQASGTDDVGKYASGYSRAERAAELIGLGTIAAGPASDMLARRRARKAGLDPARMSEHALDKYQVLKHESHAPADLFGLGVLAAPYASKRVGKFLAKHGAAVTDSGGHLTGSLCSPSQKGWDKISREDVGSAGPEKHSLQPTYTSLADISTSVGQGESKTSAAHYSLMRSLLKFSQVHPSNGMPPRKQPDHKDGLAYGDSMYDIPAGVAVSDGLSKSAEMALDLESIREATFAKMANTQESLDKLKQLEDTRPGVGEVARGAVVGGSVAPVANIVHRAMSGVDGRSGKPIFLRSGAGKLLARPHLAGAVQGAVLGGLIPVGRHYLEREAAKQKLRESVGQVDPNTTRSGVKRLVGI